MCGVRRRVRSPKLLRDSGFDDVDDYAVLDLLDAFVRKSLLAADRSAGRTRFSMLETIRQFAGEQLTAAGAATETRSAHAHYFVGRQIRTKRHVSL